MPRSVMWFRRDLRVDDHRALIAAAASGEVVPLFVVDPIFTERAGPPRLAFLARALAALDAQVGGVLVVRHGDPLTVVPQFAAEAGATAVHVTRDHGPYGRRRDAAVSAALRTDGRRLIGTGSNYAVEPGEVVKADGSGYAVFSPFARAWVARGHDAPAPAPADVSWVGADRLPTDGVPAGPHSDIPVPAADPAHWHVHWDAFAADALDRYPEQRNLPAVDGTSRMSIALRWGIVHPRQLLDDLRDERAHDVFRTELIWREFYADVLLREPRSAAHNLRRRMDALPVDTDARARDRFAAWQRGRTGYPIVDAGMRQLLATGWMHNRVRMITASFLVKDLHLPWQWGARHFMRHLLDGDVASNQHGWQWTAGTGTDPAPFFRVFNPVAQSQRFDPDGEYIRRWVTELAGVPTAAIHDPGLLRPAAYPHPIVDHATERAEALARYRSTQGGSR